MKFFKNVWNSIKQPKGWKLFFLLFFSILIIVGTILLVVLIPKQTIFHFLMYVIACFALVEFVYLIMYLTPIIKRNFKTMMSKNKYTNKFITDYAFRTYIFAICSFIIDILYSLFMGVMSIIVKSAWFGIFAVYYFVLSVIRGAILLSKKRKTQQEEKVFLGIAISLIVLTILTTIMVVVTYQFTIVSRFKGLMIYCSAAYTFYRLSLSIYNIIKAKKQDSLMVEAIKDISFVDALISIFVLQISMVQEFAVNTARLIPLNGVTGLMVCAGIITVALFMIFKYIKVKRRKSCLETVVIDENGENIERQNKKTT